jgi:hypothetical protein
MLTHAHKVIHKVVTTFGRVMRGREKWRFSEETEAKHVTGSDRTLALGAPTRQVSSGRGVRELSERTLATIHRCVRCTVVWQRTQAT